MAQARPAYDADFFAWTQEQAQLLRALPRTLAGNGLDIEHVAEEIEDLGISQIRAVNSLLMQLFAHLLKLQFFADSADRAHWISECYNFHGQAMNLFDKSMAQRIDLARAWKLGRKDAARRLKDMGQDAAIPEICPFDAATLLDDNFDLDLALAALTRAQV